MVAKNTYVVLILWNDGHYSEEWYSNLKTAQLYARDYKIERGDIIVDIVVVKL